MKRLYYATFEKGLEEVVKKIIAKQDKNAPEQADGGQIK